VCFDFLYNFCLKYFSHSKKKWARYDQKCILVFMYPSFLKDFNKNLHFLEIFSKNFSNIRFRENPSSGSRVVPCGRTDRHMTELIVAFRNFAKEPKNEKYNCLIRSQLRFVFARARWQTTIPALHLTLCYTRVGTLIVATIYLQLIQNRYMFRSFTVLHCSHQHCVQPVASDVEVVGYL